MAEKEAVVGEFEVVGETNPDNVDPQTLIDSTQALNEAVANIPSEVVISGKTVRVASRSIKDRVTIDRAIIQLQKIQVKMYSPMDMDDTSSTDAYLDSMSEVQTQFWNKAADVIVLIANGPGLKEEEKLTLDEVMESGVEELDVLVAAYADRNDPSKFLKNLSRARSF